MLLVSAAVKVTVGQQSLNVAKAYVTAEKPCLSVSMTATI